LAYQVGKDDVSRALLVRALVDVAKADRTAFATVLRMTSMKLFGICYRILGDEGETEDVLQEIYLLIWQQADRFDPARASPITWLATLARNRAIDRLRARRVRPSSPLDEAMAVADDRPDPAQQALLESEHQQLQGCLGELPSDHAGMLRQAFWDGLSYRELAEAASVPLGTMKSSIRRSLLRLRECMDR
jgi:RNA polymerase sigma factor (sigma-70 family)